MFCEKLICAGFGGQGVMSLGQLLAYAGMIEGKQVTWLPSYGPEMRGGTAYCCVITSDRPIGSPMITDDAESAIIMNRPSLLKFGPLLVAGGLLLVNSSLVEQECTREDLNVYYVPATEIALECGSTKIANMVMLGAYLEISGIVQQTSIIKAFKKVFGTKSHDLLAQNIEALSEGQNIIHNRLPLSTAV